MTTMRTSVTYNNAYLMISHIQLSHIKLSHIQQCVPHDQSHTTQSHATVCIYYIPYLSLYHVIPVLSHLAGQTKHIDEVVFLNVLQHGVQSYEASSTTHTSTTPGEQYTHNIIVLAEHPNFCGKSKYDLYTSTA